MILWEEIEKISKVRRMHPGGIEHVLARALLELKKEIGDLRRDVLVLHSPSQSSSKTTKLKKKEGD